MRSGAPISLSLLITASPWSASFLVLFKGGYNIIKMNARNDNPMRVLVPLLEFNLNARYQLGEFWV